MSKICFTGKCQTHSRKELQKLALSHNFEMVNSVTKDTSLLVTDDINKNSNKINSATKYNINIITYNEFFKQMV
jgi:NAD-dependent DNA ligase